MITKVCYFKGVYPYEYLGNAYDSYAERHPNPMSFDDFLCECDKMLLPPKRFELVKSWTFKYRPERFLFPYVDNEYYKNGLMLIDGCRAPLATVMLQGFVDELRAASKFDSNEPYLPVMREIEIKMCEILQVLFDDSSGFLHVLTVDNKPLTPIGDDDQRLKTLGSNAGSGDPAASLPINNRSMMDYGF